MQHTAARLFITIPQLENLSNQEKKPMSRRDEIAKIIFKNEGRSIDLWDTVLSENGKDVYRNVADRILALFERKQMRRRDEIEKLFQECSLKYQTAGMSELPRIEKEFSESIEALFDDGQVIGYSAISQCRDGLIQLSQVFPTEKSTQDYLDSTAMFPAAKTRKILGIMPISLPKPSTSEADKPLTMPGGNPVKTNVKVDCYSDCRPLECPIPQYCSIASDAQKQNGPYQTDAESLLRKCADKDHGYPDNTHEGVIPIRLPRNSEKPESESPEIPEDYLDWLQTSSKDSTLTGRAARWAIGEIERLRAELRMTTPIACGECNFNDENVRLECEVESLKAEVATLSKALYDCMPFVSNHLADKFFPLYDKHRQSWQNTSNIEHPDRNIGPSVCISADALEKIYKRLEALEGKDKLIGPGERTPLEVK